MSKASLQFLPSATTEGFNSHVVASDTYVNPNIIVRELIQNSSDAGILAGREKVCVEFVLKNVRREKIPGIAEYRSALESARREHAVNGDAHEAQLERIDNQLSFDEIPVLNVIDNGIGLDTEGMNALLADGMTNKTGSRAQTSGSFGVGHYSTFSASDLQYILYGGHSNNDKSLMSGHAILACHYANALEHSFTTANGDAINTLPPPVTIQNEQYRELRGKDGYLIAELLHGSIRNRFKFPCGSQISPVIKCHLDYILDRYGAGSVVSIVGFNDFRNSERGLQDQIFDAVSSSFFIPVIQGLLDVSVELPNGERSTLTREAMRDRIESRKEERRRSSKSSVISGSKAYAAYTTYCLGEHHTKSTEYGDFNVHIRRVRNEEPTHLTLHRNGMYITDEIPSNAISKYGQYKTFNAVIEISAVRNDGCANDAFQLIRGAEGKDHCDLNKKNLKHSDREKFSGLFKHIYDFIASKCEKDDSEVFHPDLFPLSLATQSDVALNPTIPQGDRGKSTITALEPIPDPLLASSATGRSSGKGKKDSHPKRSKQLQTFVETPVAMTVRRAGRFLTIKVRAKTEVIENGLLKLTLRSGSDLTCDAPIPDTPVKFSINGNAEQSKVVNGETSIGTITTKEFKTLHVELVEEISDSIALGVAIGDRKPS